VITDVGTGWQAVVGQDVAVAQLRGGVAAPVHAYLLVGPRGSGKRAAARAFAGDLLAVGASDADAARHRNLAAAEQHPDLVLVVPEGRSLRRTEADVIITEGSRSAIEGAHKVIVVDRFHSAEPEAAASLLKTIEEPPASTVFVLLAEEVPPEHVTIASRCVRIDFPPVPPLAIEAHLLALGVDPAIAGEIAVSCGGNVDRARLLASDESFAARRRAWHDVPDELDGTGAAAVRLVVGLRALIDDAQEPLTARHAVETTEIEAWEKEYGSRGSGRRGLDERQKREVRLLREDELRLGLATLAGRYRDRLVDAPDPQPYAAACARITAAAEALIRNPNEALLLEALFLDLPPLG
jgi:DNA polymerase-3 subunit delta'